MSLLGVKLAPAAWKPEASFRFHGQEHSYGAGWHMLDAVVADVISLDTTRSADPKDPIFSTLLRGERGMLVTQVGTTHPLIQSSLGNTSLQLISAYSFQKAAVYNQAVFTDLRDDSMYANVIHDPIARELSLVCSEGEVHRYQPFDPIARKIFREVVRAEMPHLLTRGGN
ncbi:MAG: hypothetical protein AAF413_04335 [Patescibacteria group bacterium]